MQPEKEEALTSVEAPRGSLTRRPLELGSGSVNQGTRLPRLRLRPAAVTELGAQRQEPALRDGLSGSQPENHNQPFKNHTSGSRKHQVEKLQYKLKAALACA